MNNEPNRKKAPEIHQISSINIPVLETGCLKNGIRYNLLKGGSQELIYIELVFNAGTTYSNQTLIASTTNIMLVEGTRHHTAQQIADTFDFYGADLRTDSNFDHAIVGLFCLNKYLDKLLPLFCEIIEESIFPESELKTIIADKKHQHVVNQEKTSILANTAMYKLTFGDHPYARRAELPDYDKVTSQLLQQFHARHYCASNCRLMILGYVTDDVMKSIDTNIGGLGIGQKVELAETPIATSIDTKPNIIKKSQTVQSSLRMGMRTIKMNHPDYHKLSMLVTILGGYFGSRLMSNIREEKGYTYGIYSQLSPQLQSGLLIIAGDVKSGYSLQVADEVRNEMKRLKDEPVGEDELTIVRNYMMGELLQLFDGPFACSEAIAKAIDMGVGINYFKEEQKSILTTTATELQEIANKHFDFDQLTTAIAGNE